MLWGRHWSLWVIFFQAVLALLGSLYFSNFGDPVHDIFLGTLFQGPGYEPCTLCWWARVLMYPLVILSGVALLRNDTAVWRYIIPFVALGIPLEIYHYLLQKFRIPTTQFCTSTNPCTALEVNYFGVVTIPFLCGVAFLIIGWATYKLYRFYRSSHGTV